jgi:hypothetical protein
MLGRSANHPLSAPLPFVAIVLAVIVSFLALDRFASPGEQLLLGVATWALLISACAPLGPEDRVRTLLVVAVASAAEAIGSLALGAYTYRLDNLPAFVPPGHGLVFLAGLRISQTPLVRRHRGAFIGAAVAIAGAWGVSGLLLLGHADVLGAVTGVGLIYVLLRGRAAPLYAGVFLLVGFLEIYGTSIGAWHWAATTPGTPLSAGNPPSGIAGVYVLFDVLAIALAPRALTALTRLGRLARLDARLDPGAAVRR